MLGKALREALAAHEVIAVDKAQLDITNAEAAEKIFAENHFDFCVNAAAYTAVDKAEAEFEKAKLVNAEAVGILAENCAKRNVKLIHFSTDYVFDGKPEAQPAEALAKAGEEIGYREDAETNPVNAYGKSKLLGEELIQRSGCEFAIIRLSWLFGDGKNFVATMLRLAAEKPEIKVVSDQIGKPTYAKDLAEAVKNLIENKLWENSCREIFHLTNEGVTSWFEFAQKIFELKKLPVKVIPITSSEFPTPARRPKNSVLLNTKLPRLRNYEEALGDYLKNYKKS
jgi:dTDP-4-dehydrorhamnose reductase